MTLLDIYRSTGTVTRIDKITAETDIEQIIIMAALWGDTLTAEERHAVTRRKLELQRGR